MATIATHNGSTVRQAHNVRSYKCIAKEQHIDLSRPHEIWHHEWIGDAYHDLFDKAREVYNAAQTRADRRLQGSYLSEVKKDPKQHPAYEMIIGVYGDVSSDVSKEIMRAFVDGWHDRNPNLYLIGAYYHADEEGKNPHVHIDYIPVAHGYKRGPETQTGLVRALAQQGIVKRGRQTAQIQWEARENAVLESLCNARGIDVDHPQAGDAQIKHLETRVYKAQIAAESQIIAVGQEAQQAELETQVDLHFAQIKADEQLEALRVRTEGAKMALRDALDDLDKLEDCIGQIRLGRVLRAIEEKGLDVDEWCDWIADTLNQSLDLGVERENLQIKDDELEL